MKAIGTTDPQTWVSLELPRPQVTGRDILVKIHFISVNPVDFKVRQGLGDSTPHPPKILGWDAAGEVVSVGDKVENFKPGDRVFYAGDITRPGSYSEYQLVDERIVGSMPPGLSFTEAAALPLTALTAYEGLMQMGITTAPFSENQNKVLLVIGGSGGVGSMVIQLAKEMGLKVVATAGREESQKWVKELGADEFLDHHHPLAPQLKEKLGLDHVDFIFNTFSTELYWDQMSELIRPLGKIVCIVESGRPLDWNLFQYKSVQISWEFMFTRSLFQTADMAIQGDILNKIGSLFEEGRLKGTAKKIYPILSPAALEEAHQELKGKHTLGKIVFHLQFG